MIKPSKYFMTPQKIQKVMKEYGITSASELYEQLVLKCDLCRDMYDMDTYVVFQPGSLKDEAVSVHLLTFNALNWYLYQHTPIQPLFTPEVGFLKYLPAKYTRNLGKILAYRDSRDDDRVRKAFHAFSEKHGIKVLRSIYQSQEHMLSDMERFGKFCLERSDLQVYSYNDDPGYEYSEDGELATLGINP